MMTAHSSLWPEIVWDCVGERLETQPRWARQQIRQCLDRLEVVSMLRLTRTFQDTWNLLKPQMAMKATCPQMAFVVLIEARMPMMNKVTQSMHVP